MSGIAVSDATTAAAGLAGLATATVLAGAQDAVVSSLKVVGGRFEHMAQLLRTTADTFELASMAMPGLLPKSWMSQQIGDGLGAMGDLNRAAGF